MRLKNTKKMWTRKTLASHVSPGWAGRKRGEKEAWRTQRRLERESKMKPCWHVGQLHPEAVWMCVCRYSQLLPRRLISLQHTLISCRETREGFRSSPVGQTGRILILLEGQSGTGRVPVEDKSGLIQNRGEGGGGLVLQISEEHLNTSFKETLKKGIHMEKKLDK